MRPEGVAALYDGVAALVARPGGSGVKGGVHSEAELEAKLMGGGIGMGWSDGWVLTATTASALMVQQMEQPPN